MSLLYLDTCCIIYLIEAAGSFHAAVVRRVMAHNAVPGTTLVTSSGQAGVPHEAGTGG